MANPGISKAGQNIASTQRELAGGATPLAGKGSNQWTVDSSDLVTLSTRLQKVITDVSNLDKVLSSLDKKLGSVGGKLGLTGSGGGSSGGLTTGNFSAPPNNGGSAGAAARTLAMGAMGEVGAQWAGKLNTAMVSAFSGGVGLDTMARQQASVFGGQTPLSAMQGYGRISNTGQADLSQAIATQQVNPFLMAGAGSQSFKRQTGFSNALTSMSPGMTAAQASGVMSKLTSPQAAQYFNRFGQGGQAGLYNARTKSTNTVDQTFRSTILSAAHVSHLSAGQAKSMARNPGQWAIVQQGLEQMGLSAQDTVPFQQYMAGGMSVKGGTPKGAIAASLRASATAGTNMQNTAVEQTAGLQNNLNTLSAGLKTAGAGVLALSSPLAMAALGIGVMAKAAFSAAAAMAEAKVMLGGAKGVAGSFGRGGPGGASRSSGAGGPGGAGSTTVMPLDTVGKGKLSSETGAAEKSRISRMSGRGARAVGAGLAGQVAGQVIQNGAAPGSARSRIGSALSFGASGAMTGAMIGEMTPAGPVGALIGGVAGGIIGGVAGAFMGDPATGSTSTSGMQPNLAHSITAMQRANPNIKISSGHRTDTQQRNLYAMKGGKGVARPGQSAHQRGKAADLGPASQFGWIAKNASKFGLYTPAGAAEPWHVQSMGDASAASATSTTPAQITGADIVSQAQSFTGTPYSWGGGNAGGATLGTDQGAHTVGLDCSGLIVAAYGKLGIQLPHSTYSLVKMGSAVSDISQAQPGDLIFYENNGHVAIYMGNGQQIAAPHTGAFVSSGPVDSGISAIRRISGVKGEAAAANAAAAQGGVTPAASAAGGKKTGAGGVSVGGAGSFFASVSKSWLKSGGPNGGGGGGGRGNASSGASARTSSTTAGGTNATSTGGGTGGAQANSSVVNAVKAITTDRLIQLAMLTGSALESNQNPAAAGGGAYGAWQIQMLKGRDVTPDQARDPNFAAKFMLGEYTSAVHGIDNALWKTDPARAAEQAAYAAERPAVDYFSSQGADRVSSSYNLAVSEVGGPMGDPSGLAGSFAPMRRRSSGMPSGSGSSPMGGSGARITLNMPVQVVGASAADAQHLVQMVMQELKSQTSMSAISGAM